MKPSFQPLRPDTDRASFASYWVRANRFGFHWHYHPELELCYIHRGSGTRLVGDSVRPFADGDLVLLGPNLPHTWISQQYANPAPDNMQVFVVQFLPDLLPESWLKLPEWAGVAALLRQSARGVFVPEGNRYADQLTQLDEATGATRFVQLLALLADLAAEAQPETLASQQYAPVLSHENERRIQTVFSFIHTHFTESLSLAQIADIACMNGASFCRYFKKNTGQTLTDYINDLRINRACQLLLESREPIMSIAQTVGFNSFTHFNQSFTRRKGLLPSEYRQRIGR